MKKIIILLGVLTVSLTSCLKDKPNVDFSNIAPFAELFHSGKAYFTSDAITSSADTFTVTAYVNITGQYAPTSDVTVGVAIDNSLITQFNTADITYESAMPEGSYSFSTTSVTIKAGAGNRLASFPVTFYRSKLDPSKSYMLPIKLTSATSGTALSSNFNAHFYHFIGNDFAGTYTWRYRRYNDGVGLVATTDATNVGKISPISPTEFEMVTGYNSTGVNYDVKFTRTVTAGVVTYSNWSVIFNAANLAKYSDAGIMNVQAPKFNLPPPTTKTDHPVFELQHISMGTAAGSLPRYIIDTYSK